MLRSVFIPSFLLLAVTASDAASQGVSISAKIGGKGYEASGSGSCKHEPQASIYSVPAALWRVEYSGTDDSKLKQADMTLWRPKAGGADQFSIALETKSSSHRIAVSGRGDQVGSGKLSLLPAGSGGRFEIKGKDADGTPLDIVITCPAFAGIVAEGG